MMKLAWIPEENTKRQLNRTSNNDGNAANYCLVQGVMEGESHAAFDFCDRFGPKINRWVWRLLGTDAEHDEMVQQVYVGIFSALPRIKDYDALDAFVDSITIRTVRKEIRRRKYRRMLMGSPVEISDDFVRDSRNPFKDAHIRTFYRLLDKLSTEERLVFVLKHFEGLTMEEIASATGYSVRTAKRRLYAGMASLKELMMKEPVLISLLEEF